MMIEGEQEEIESVHELSEVTCRRVGAGTWFGGVDKRALQRRSLGMFGNSVHLRPAKVQCQRVEPKLGNNFLAYNLLQSVLVYGIDILLLIRLTFECTATIALSKYDHHRMHLFQASGGLAQEHINDIIAAYDVTIMYCIFVTTLVCAEFLFPFFCPMRGYAKWWRLQAIVDQLAITKGVKR
ncbi:hypothetical protein BDQ17DRAFT_1335981 [Cyathus striatus]|nr:hypothetical protein BDQ17DRAFT_1335981 [Cyathus striatus]